MGCHSLLQEIFPTQGSNPDLLHCRQILYLREAAGSLREEAKSEITSVSAAFSLCLPLSCLPLQVISLSFHICIPSCRDYCSCFSSVQFSRSVVSDSLRPHESQRARPPCPSPTPGVHSELRPSSQQCHPAISSSVVPFSSEKVNNRVKTWMG